MTQNIMTTHHRTGRVPQSPTLSSRISRTTWPFHVKFPDNRREDWPSEWIQSGWSNPAPSSRNKQSNQLYVKGMVLWPVCQYHFISVEYLWNCTRMSLFYTRNMQVFRGEDEACGSKSFLWGCCWRYMFILSMYVDVNLIDWLSLVCCFG